MDIFEAALLIAFLIVIYLKFCRRPKVKVIKTPTVKEIRRQKKRGRRFRRLKRFFKLPYRGSTQVLEFDPKKPYIESAWNEIEGKK